MIENLKKLYRMYSTYVVLAINILYGYWAQLPLETQQHYLQQFPFLPYVVPILGFVAFALARIKPQGL